MAIAILPFVVMLVGLLMWLLAKTNAIVAEIGKIMFVIGLFWLVYFLGNHQVRLLP